VIERRRQRGESRVLVLRLEGGKICEGTAYLDTELITKLFS
jgi:ketosteroid isomerase-like protein